MNGNVNENEKEKEINPKLEAVVRIRQLATGLRNEWSSIQTSAEKIQGLLDRAKSKLEAEGGNADFSEPWNAIAEHRESLSKNLQTVQEKLSNRDPVGLESIWSGYRDHSAGLANNYSSLESLGMKSLPEGSLEDWRLLWQVIRQRHDALHQIAAACEIQLTMIEKLAPAEIDDMTASILRAIPHSYTVDDARQYQDEYIQAWEDIKRETQSQNLWDKFLTLLAGGATESPAQRVMMQRWLEGERGELRG